MDYEEERLSRRLVVEAIRALWPGKQLVRDCIVPAGINDPEGFVELWLKKCNGDLTAAEQTINRVYLADLLLDADDLQETTPGEFALVAQAYVAFLEAEIRRIAPGVAYDVKVSGDFNKIPVVDNPDGSSIRHAECLDVRITCSLRRSETVQKKNRKG